MTTDNKNILQSEKLRKQFKEETGYNTVSYKEFFKYVKWLEDKVVQPERLSEENTEKNTYGGSGNTWDI